MERKAYEYLEEGEGSWWYRGRAWFATRMLGRFHSDARVLDFGAGFGALYPTLARYGAVDAYEIDEQAAARCRTRGYGAVFTKAAELDARRGSYDLVCAFDVLEHMEDDAATLRLFHELLAPGGTLLLTVPAFQALWSEHDVLHKHFRRYTRRMLLERLAAAGFRVRRASYWNMFLFPVAWALRLAGKGGGGALTPWAPVNAALTAAVYSESRLVPALRLPFGTGLVAVARRT